jgi:HlyD family secretion protein
MLPKSDAGAPHVHKPHDPNQTPDRRTLWVLRGEKPQMVNIRTGVSDGSVTEVLEGDLNQGDAVITDNLSGDAKSSSSASQQPPRFRGF